MCTYSVHTCISKLLALYHPLSVFEILYLILGFVLMLIYSHTFESRSLIGDMVDVCSTRGRMRV